MKLRNNIFAAAFDYLKRNTDIKTQKELAVRMGVTETTITRILRDYVEVTEDIITKLQTASGCIFNLQWLRGEDPIHMLAEDLNNGLTAHFLPQEGNGNASHIDQSSLVNALLAAKDQLIEELKEKYEKLEQEKEKMEQEKDARIADITKLAEERLHRNAELHRIIDANNFGLTDFHFPIGSAEGRTHKQK